MNKLFFTLPNLVGALSLLLAFTALQPAIAFDVDTSPQPANYVPLAPADRAAVDINPPSMVWRPDARAVSYRIELARAAAFSKQVVKVEDIPLSFYNHSQPLETGLWYWRYYVIDGNGQISSPGPTRRFTISAQAVALPIPNRGDLLKNMAAHPRIYTNAGELTGFRARRLGPALAAWQRIEAEAGELLKMQPEAVEEKVPLSQAIERIKSVPTPGSSTWKKGQNTHRQVFVLDENGNAFWVPGYSYRRLASEANKAETLAFAYLVSNDPKYAVAARRWLRHVAQFRLDYHLDIKQRAYHDSVVYAYEQGVCSFAIAYDHLYDILTPAERAAAIAHVEYHAHAAVEWLKSVNIEVEYQQSHPQQCMHALLRTLLATANDSPTINQWVAWIVPQYLNRIPWTSPDGGIFEGPTYGHKFRWILDGLVAIRTATGIDLFKKPELHNSGAFWLYAMNLNYWYNHFGDNYSLHRPYANNTDSYISGLIAEMTADPYVKWYAQTSKTNPDNIPFRYLSEGELIAKPPIDIPQTRAFLETGQVSAYDRFYDHSSNRIFFRSSQWGAHSHSHADQNSFVLHAGEEILAGDTGYYTYYGDDYHLQWSKSSFSHNTVIVNGKSQRLDIEGKGRIASFFNGGRFTYFQGDAARAYEKPLQSFNRSILFIRPNLYIINDELKARQKSSFGWLLNTFAQPQINGEEQRIVVPQQDMRLQIDQRASQSLTYTADDKRPYPVKTKAWSRITEAYPQAWHLQAQTPAVDDVNIVSLLQTYRTGDDARHEIVEHYQAGNTSGIRLRNTEGNEGVVLFRREQANPAALAAGKLQSDAQAAAVFYRKDGQTAHWTLVSGHTLNDDRRALLQTENAVSASAEWDTPAAKAVLHFEGKPGEVTLACETEPRGLFISSERPQDAKPLRINYRDGKLQFKSTRSRFTVWIDPVVDLTQPIPGATLTVKDSTSRYDLALQGAWSQTGQWVYSIRSGARENGSYRFERSDRAEMELLVQDNWDGALSTHGTNATTADWREAAELFFHVSPTTQVPRFTATIAQSHRGIPENLLRNGDFEAGLPGYPPRGWSLTRDYRINTKSTPDDDLGWAQQSDQNPFHGKSTLRFFRGGGMRNLTSPPMRLLTGGTYRLRFVARGDADKGEVRIVGSNGTALTVPIATGNEWKEYERTVQLPEGYTTVEIVLGGR